MTKSVREESNTHASLSELGRFTAFYCRIAGWRLAVTLALDFLLGLTQGIGLVAVLPLLSALGYLPDVSVPAKLQWATAALDAALPEPKLVSGLVVFVVAMAMLASGRYVESYLRVRIEQSFILRLRETLFEALLSARWDHLVARRGSDASHVMMTDVNRVSFTARQALNWVIGAVTAACYLGAALYVQFVFSAIVLLTGAPLLWIIRRRNPQFGLAGQVQRERMRSFFGLVEEHVQGLKLVKSLNLEAAVAQDASTVMREVRDDQVRLGRMSALVQWVFEAGIAVVVASFLWLGLSRLRLSPAVVVVIVLIFVRLYPRLAKLLTDWQTILTGMPSFAAYQRMVEDLNAHAEPAALSRGTPVPLAFGDRLSLHEVDFRYGTDGGRPALRDVSLTIRPHRTYALAGPSGAGKTTLGDVLLGLLAPTQGQILLDGEPLVDERLAGWRQRVAYVPQETFLFHDTIARNVRWGSPDASEEELWEALDQAAATDFVRRLPDGLETVIGDRGHRLSGGERQRLALARALLRQPLFLLLDEATNALDTENERRIQEAIHRLHGRLTLLVIAHRLSTIQHADQILVLDGGRIVQQGTWHELSTQGGWFSGALTELGLTSRTTATP